MTNIIPININIILDGFVFNLSAALLSGPKS